MASPLPPAPTLAPAAAAADAPPMLNAAALAQSLCRLRSTLDCPVARQELLLVSQLYVKYCHQQRHFLHWRAFARVRRRLRRAIDGDRGDGESASGGRRCCYLRKFAEAAASGSHRPSRGAAIHALQLLRERRDRLAACPPAAERCARLLLPYLAMGHMVRLYTVLLAVLARCHALTGAASAAAADAYAELRCRLSAFPVTDACAAARRLGKRLPRRIDDVADDDSDADEAEAPSPQSPPPPPPPPESPPLEPSGDGRRRRKKRRRQQLQSAEEEAADAADADADDSRHRRAADLLLRHFADGDGQPAAAELEAKAKRRRRCLADAVDADEVEVEEAKAEAEPENVDVAERKKKKGKKNKKKKAKRSGNMFVRGQLPSTATADSQRQTL